MSPIVIRLGGYQKPSSVHTRAAVRFGHLSNKVRPIRTPGDCRGIRTQMSELHGEAFHALGFEPIPADVKEFVEEIGSDRFQAQDNPLTNIFNFGVHRHHRYITLSGHLARARSSATKRIKDSPAHSRESLANATSNPHKTTPAM